ncbi:MAG: C25 family cysteine peptidase, partial [Candidatus Neomarinimicrobiota bacterium]
MKRILLILILIFPLVPASGAMTIEIIKSTTGQLIIHADIEINSEEDLRPTTVLVGLPDNRLPGMSISYGSQVNHNFSREQAIIETGWSGNQVLNGLETASLTISPQANGNQAFTELTITIIFPQFSGRYYRPDQQQERLLKARVINWPVARSWLTLREQSLFKSPELPAGRWFKFSAAVDGMTKITGQTILAALNTGENIDSRSLHLYTGSSLGRDRTYDFTMFNKPGQDFYPNLIEIPFELKAEKNELLQDGDEIWFWAQGGSGFDQKNGEINWHQNLYFKNNTYWLLLPHDPGQRGQRINIAENDISTTLNFDYGLEYVHFEEDNINPYNSGLGWGNARISGAATFSHPVELVQPVEALKISGSAAFLGFEAVPTRFKNTKHAIQLSANSINISSVTWSNPGQKILKFSFSLSSIPNNFQSFDFSNISNNPNSNPYFDYLSFSYGRKLSIEENPFDFFAPLKGNDISFTITGSNPLVWNITKPDQPFIIPVENAGDLSIISVSLDPDLYSRFSVFKADQLTEIKEVIFIGEKNFDLIKNAAASISQLIIGPAEFEAAADPLINHREKTRYIPLELIYDEFSGGNQDPIAIRDFIKWTQEKWPKPAPYCALLMGDGDYDYRNISGLSNIKVPTIEVGLVNSFPSDDRLAAINGNIPEIALGRFPAGTSREVSDFVEKIIKFETGQKDGSWKQRITLVADDPARPEREKHELSTGKSHTFNSERLAAIIPDFMDVKKLYLVDFPESSDGSIFGVVKPEATQALIQNVRRGTSIINFIGHGNSKQWAQEKLLIINESRNDALKLKTGMKLPLWIAGTCNWGHFDKLQEDSFAEVIIRIPEDAAIAVISTTRGITVSSNILYLERIFKGFFPAEGLSSETVGTVLLSTKTGGRDGELFILLGDPGMPIPITGNLIADAEITPDTLETLEVGTLTGTHTLNSSGSGILTVVDGSSPVTKYFNFFSTLEEISYEQPGPVLFRGKFDFNSNDFSTDFRIPKDISYTPKGAAARFFLSALNGQEALGASGGIHLTLGEPSSDVQGPIITFETEDHRILRTGDQFGENENLIIRISDPIGINITGEKGHEILLTDINSGSVQNISEGFIYDINS